MANLNKIILVGRLTADPERRTTLDATPITKFNLAVDRNKSAGAQKETDFFDVIAWGTLAEASGSNLSKGSMALVEGRVQNKSFDNKEGQRKYVTEIVAGSIVLLEKSGSKSGAKAGPQAPVKEEFKVATDASFLDEDLPF